MLRFLILLVWCIVSATIVYGQTDQVKSAKKKRVLLILDASGSMVEKWQGETKWSLALSNLSKILDSFGNQNKTIEIGIRLLGHQSPRSANNCQDTKLELPFRGGYTSAEVSQVLNRFKPQGHTPLALALSEAEADFVNANEYENTIILITDGIENCSGAPCEVAQRLTQKKIAISPYIIGMGIDTSSFNKLECIGRFVDVRNRETFSKVMTNILTTVAKQTMLEIEFLDSLNNPLYNIPYTLYERKQNIDLYHSINTQTQKPDPIKISSQHNYKLQVHTIPPVWIDSLPIIYGQNNKITVPLNISNITYENHLKTDAISTVVYSSQNTPTYMIDNSSNLLLKNPNEWHLHPILYPETKSKNRGSNNSAINLTAMPQGTLLLIHNNPEIEAYILPEKKQYLKPLKAKNGIQKITLTIGNYIIISKNKNSKIDRTKQIALTIENGGNHKIELF